MWLAVVIAGTSMLRTYSLTPGVAGTPTAQWPARSQIDARAGYFTLVMTIHPHCPCSRASVGELAILMAHSYGRLSAFVIFVQPPGFNASWTRSDLWSSAGSIPGVTRVIDGGSEAKLFGAATSGQTMVYDGRGRLVFSGGITAARGHFGDNAGVSAIVRLLGTQATDASVGPVSYKERRVVYEERTAVYGCPLFAPSSPRKNEQRKCVK